MTRKNHRTNPTSDPLAQLVLSMTHPDLTPESIVSTAIEVFDSLRQHQQSDASNLKPPVCMFHVSYVLRVLSSLVDPATLPQQRPQLLNALVAWVFCYETYDSFEPLMNAPCTCDTNPRLRTLGEPFDIYGGTAFTHAIADAFEILFLAVGGTSKG